MAGGPLVACQHCATLHVRAPIEPGATASCRRCGYALYRQSPISLDGWIALVVAAIIVFGIANAFPIVELNIGGLGVEASMPGALWLTWQQGHRLLSVMTGMFGFWLPLAQLFFTLWALLAIRTGRLPADFQYGMRVLNWVLPWSMIPVLMLAILVSIVKFSGLARLALGPAIWAFIILTFLLTGLGRLSAHRIWRYAEDAGLVPVAAADTMGSAHALASCHDCSLVQHVDNDDIAQSCYRCGARIHQRKPDAAVRVWALVIAAAILYIPANLLPVMRVISLTGDSAHTILGGVLELWRLGSWDLAIIVFIASVVVPLTKLMALSVLMTARRWRGALVQRQRTRLYELIEFIGQWSMLDVFVVILMTSMANFPGISQVIAGPGAASFGMVVILTMLATMSYDPRRGWDRSPGRRRDTIQSAATVTVEADSHSSL